MNDNEVMKRLLISLFVIGVTCIVFPNLPGDLYKTLFPPNSTRVEPLIHPVAVKGWSDKGLLLADGRFMMPAGMRKLPIKSELLALATKRGVDVLPNGHVFGQVSMFHWCGNDPIKQDLRRFDLGDLLAYYREGECIPEPVDDGWSRKPSTIFYRERIDISELHRFRDFQVAYHEQMKEDVNAKNL